MTSEQPQVTSEDLPHLSYKSSKMTGALNDLKEEKEELELEKPLVSVSVNNPLSWLMKVINKLKKEQTTTFTFKLGVPLIALPVLIAAFAALFFGLGKVTTKTETVDEQISRAGVLKITKEGETSVSYLVLPDGQALKLEAPETVNLSSLDGRRILISGLFNKQNLLVKVASVADMELLPEAPKPLPTPTPTIAPVPLLSQEDVIRTFFELISEGRVTEAVGMMASKSIADDAQKQAWANKWAAFNKIEVKSIEPVEDLFYKVELDVEMEPEAATVSPMPYYGWGDGSFTRWVQLEKEGTLYKIVGLATGP